MNAMSLSQSAIRGTEEVLTLEPACGIGKYMQRLIQLACCVLALLAILSPPVSATAAQSVVVQDINFGTVDADDFTAGAIALSREPVWWESDTPWRITVESLDPNLGSSFDSGYIKPLGDLQFKFHAFSQWITMQQHPQVLKDCYETGSGTIYADWRIQLDWALDRPGQYGAELLFTISEL